MANKGRGWTAKGSFFGSFLEVEGMVRELRGKTWNRGVAYIVANFAILGQ